jgi:23S rRNA (uracil1939-C5)-methyltransferase
MHIYLQGGGPDSIQPFAPADSVLAYRLPAQQVEIRFLPSDFTQVNAVINRQMIERVLQMLEPDEHDRVLDLFCGLGNFTLPLARLAGSVTGVEGDSGLVKRGQYCTREDRVRVMSPGIAGTRCGQAGA